VASTLRIELRPSRPGAQTEREGQKRRDESMPHSSNVRAEARPRQGRKPGISRDKSSPTSAYRGTRLRHDRRPGAGAAELVTWGAR
jgi:hypothetical protein